MWSYTQLDEDCVPNVLLYRHDLDEKALQGDMPVPLIFEHDGKIIAAYGPDDADDVPPIVFCLNPELPPPSQEELDRCLACPRTHNTSCRACLHRGIP